MNFFMMVGQFTLPMGCKRTGIALHLRRMTIVHVAIETFLFVIFLSTDGALRLGLLRTRFEEPV
jgi:hypothetical protein